MQRIIVYPIFRRNLEQPYGTGKLSTIHSKQQKVIRPPLEEGRGMIVQMSHPQEDAQHSGMNLLRGGRGTTVLIHRHRGSSDMTALTSRPLESQEASKHMTSHLPEGKGMTVLMMLPHLGVQKLQYLMPRLPEEGKLQAQMSHLLGGRRLGSQQWQQTAAVVGYQPKIVRKKGASSCLTAQLLVSFQETLTAL